MKPVKAFAHQNHEAHIQVHISAIKDPKIAALVGQNPQAQTMMAAMMAHINEHVAFEYRNKIEEQLGVPLPKTKENEVVPEEVENEIASMMAMAASKLFQKNKAEAAQQQAQQAQQDPVIQMQMQELELKKQEIEIKKTKLQIDAAAQADKLEVEKGRVEAQKEIAGMQVGAKVAKDKAESAARQEMEGLRIGADVAKTQAQMQQQRQTLHLQRADQRAARQAPQKKLEPSKE
jgi:hypothetical protein